MKKNLSKERELEAANHALREAMFCAGREMATMIHALRDAVAMLDASSFGGHKPYRCLTPTEQKRLEEIRALSLF